MAKEALVHLDVWPEITQSTSEGVSLFKCALTSESKTSLHVVRITQCCGEDESNRVDDEEYIEVSRLRGRKIRPEGQTCFPGASNQHVSGEQ